MIARGRVKSAGWGQRHELGQTVCMPPLCNLLAACAVNLSSLASDGSTGKEGPGTFAYCFVCSGTHSLCCSSEGTHFISDAVQLPARLYIYLTSLPVFNVFLSYIFKFMLPHLKQHVKYIFRLQPSIPDIPRPNDSSSTLF